MDLDCYILRSQSSSWTFEQSRIYSRRKHRVLRYLAPSQALDTLKLGRNPTKLPTGCCAVAAYELREVRLQIIRFLKHESLTKIGNTYTQFRAKLAGLASRHTPYVCAAAVARRDAC